MKRLHEYKSYEAFFIVLNELLQKGHITPV